MNTYGIIAIIVAVIFVGIMGYILYTSLRVNCADNQQYVSCDGGSKKCYPICGDDTVLNCDWSACVPVCGDNQQVYGPASNPSCSGEYKCGEICDPDDGKIFDCDSWKCVSACSSPDIAHVCGNDVQCGPKCTAGTSWDCSNSVCKPDEDLHYHCDPTVDYPEITTESCDTSDPCCYQNLQLSAACFNNNKNSFSWIGRSTTDAGDLADVDMFSIILDAGDTPVPYQGDPSYLSSISRCPVNNSATKPGFFSRLFSKKDTPRNSLNKATAGSANYPWYGQNYTNKYLRVHAQYTDSDGNRHTKTSEVLPPKMKTSKTVKMWTHHDKDYFVITAIDMADSLDDEWQNSYYSKRASSGSTTGLSMSISMSHNQKILFQSVDCIPDLSTIKKAALCS